MVPDNPAIARAFNLGSDARLAGVPLSDNDYSSDQKDEYQSWRRGWNDVHYFWGHDSKRLYRPLPPIREEVTA